MSNTIIKVENLSKRYRIGAKEEGYKTFREAIMNSLTAPIRNFKRLSKLTKFDDNSGKEHRAKSIESNPMPSAPRPLPSAPCSMQSSQSDDIIWALRDVSFEVKQGEVVGIIGRNGSGKTTLLKILSRITEPTTGEVKLYGRVSSLLEVGTGFHPELTGRENIYLNGAVLGMKKFEIDRKFDEIVDFSEIEKFLDTPVKRYSSGMYVRLAFAVAAHLEPEILLVDEVLAVGDVAFQKKCLGKMGDVAREGRTVLFVSHNMPMITSLCPRCLLLESGRIALEGQTSDVVMSYYTSGVSSPSYFEYSANEKKIGDEYVRLLSGAVLNQQNKAATEFDISEPLKIQMRFQVLKEDKLRLLPNFHFHSGDGSYAFVSGVQDAEILSHGEYTAECNIPGNLLNDDTYFVGLAISSFERGIKVHFYEQSALSFVVKDNLEDRRGYGGRIPGVVRPALDWRIERIS